MAYPIHRLTLRERDLHYSTLQLYNVLPHSTQDIDKATAFKDQLKALLTVKSSNSTDEYLLSHEQLDLTLFEALYLNNESPNFY